MAPLGDMADTLGNDLMGIEVGNILSLEEDPSFAGLEDSRKGE